MDWKTKKNVRTALMWGLIVFAGWSGYRLYNERAFSGFPRAIVRVYGKFPIVGTPIRQWVYGKSYRRSRRYYRRGRRNGVSRRRRYRRRRRR